MLRLQRIASTFNSNRVLCLNNTINGALILSVFNYIFYYFIAVEMLIFITINRKRKVLEITYLYLSRFFLKQSTHNNYTRRN